jgi:hypothetical protein
MKKVLTLIFLGMSLGAAAQTSNAEAELWQNATVISRKIAAKLELNEQEYIQVKALTLQKLRTVNKITDNYAYNPRLQRLKLAEVENGYQWQLRNILNAKQVEQYLARKEESESVLISILIRKHE